MTSSAQRIFLSPPHVSERERQLLVAAFDSNWIAPLGPHVDAFEAEMSARLGCRAAVALSSGTAALHLALLVVGVKPGDVVITSTLTFVATANAIRYVGAEPVFVDVDADTWMMDPDGVAEALDRHRGRVGAIVTVDLYGQCVDYDRVMAVARDHGVPVVEDAAEALGATYRGAGAERQAGTLGVVGVLSFNGNKILTTSGGGMLVSDDEALMARARYLATQAREPAVHYEHREVGYNYRLSNLLAAVGRGQLQWLDERIARRRAIYRQYVEQLGQLADVTFLAQAGYGSWTAWLTCLLCTGPTPVAATTRRDRALAALAEADIEARPLWKPMHLQPAYADADVIGGACAQRLFATGMCLPSGSALTEAQVDRVANIVVERLR